MFKASLIRSPKLHANSLFWCPRWRSTLFLVATAGAHQWYRCNNALNDIVVKVFRVEAESDLFAFWGFFDVIYDWVYPVGWLVHDSDDVMCDHPCTRVICGLEQCAAGEWLERGLQLVEWGTSLPWNNLTCPSNLGALPKHLAWKADHGVPQLLSWYRVWY